MTPSPRSSAIKWTVVAVAAFAVLIAAGFLFNGALSRFARDRAEQSLKKSFASDLEVENIAVNVFPSFHLTGEGLVLHYHGRKDLPPLITIRKVTADTNLLSLLAGHVRRVRVEGLEIQVPPKSEQSAQAKPSRSERIAGFVIDEITADGTTLKTLPKDPKKDPLVWQIQRLMLHSAGASSQLTFQATLVNAKPPGEIESSGKFGPWQAEQPSETPVEGSYTFQNADLSVFPGISGKLSSTGTYHGVLERIEAQGKTDTPDFTLKISGNPVHLTTQFQAVVDGTDGDTRLQPVTGQFGHSSVTARGSIAGDRAFPGKTIALDVAVDSGRLEDMLHLATKGNDPSMSGAISFRAKLVIPPGNIDVAQKMKLDGQFTVASAHFAELNVQQKVNELSHRGEGEPKTPDSDTVASDFSGQFHLANGVMGFPSLSFRVPGVQVALSGDYKLFDQSMDFHGTARLEAKLSQMTTGVKSFLLKALDPIFERKDAGTELPISITGTRDKPSFGLDLKHAHRTAAVNPPVGSAR
jgi:hypothetical protein